MGLFQTKFSFPREIIPYMCSLSNEPLVIDPNVELIIKPSRLPLIFPSGRNLGLFTKHTISKGTIICQTGTNISTMANDGMVDLGALLCANNSKETYNAWINLKKHYYNLENAEKIINIRIISYSNDCYYEAICDIPADTELVRMYGFTTWVFELFDILNTKTIAGFAKFIHELNNTIHGDPFEKRIYYLDMALKIMIQDIDTLDLDEFDTRQQIYSPENLGKQLNELYLKVCP